MDKKEQLYHHASTVTPDRSRWRVSATSSSRGRDHDFKEIFGYYVNNNT